MSSTQTTSAPLMLSVSGCRGIVGASLTPETIARFVAAAVTWTRSAAGAERPVFVLARDGRAGGECVARLASGALALAGCRVIDLGVATTPTAGVMVLHHKAHAGLVATASHNPAQWNGLKVVTNKGGAPGPRDAADIVARFNAGEHPWQPHDRLGTVERDGSAALVHVQRVLDATAELYPLNNVRRRGFRVVLDSVNASGALAGRMLLEALGCRLFHVNAETTGVFPHPPEPTRENLASLGEQVRHHQADVGFAQDPDADRLAMLDERGEYIGEEYTLALGVKSWLAMLPAAQAKAASVAANLSTSRMIDDVAGAFGARVVRTAVGEANVVEGMVRNSCALGGEGNGGVIWPEVVPIRDSLGAMALTLALLTRQGQALSDAARAIPAYAIVKRKIDVREGLAARAVSAVKAAFAARGAKLNDADGVRADFTCASGAAWVHVRASNTEPIIRLIAEAPDAGDAHRALDDVQRLVDGA